MNKTIEQPEPGSRANPTKSLRAESSLERGGEFSNRHLTTENDGARSQPLRMAFSVQETAKILGISEKSVRRLIDRRLLQPSTALRHLLIPRKEIERFLDETSRGV